MATFFKKLLDAWTYLFSHCPFYTCLFMYFISILFNLINCSKVRYLQSFVFIFASKAKLNGYLHIVAYFNITKHTNITRRILEKIEPSKKDGGWKRWEIRYKKVFGVSFFLVTRLGLVAQIPLSWAKKETIEKLPKKSKLYSK